MKSIMKISLLGGSIFGAVAGLAVALSLDFMMGSSPGESWYVAVQNDVRALLGENWAAKEWFIDVGVITVILLISSIGAGLGAVCGIITGKVFKTLTK